MNAISYELFEKCIQEIVSISDQLMDGWKIHNVEELENGKYLTKKLTKQLANSTNNEIIVNFEYHIVYSLSYGVPIICFAIWKQDGTSLSLEDYWQLNENFKDLNMYETLTQLDHPVLCRPFLTLHPCRTNEILAPLLTHSKNPIISWLSIVAPYVHLNLIDEYIKYC